MSDENRIFLSLGSNIKDRYQHLKNGIKMINEHPHIWVIQKSYVYESAPMYNPDQNFFYNMVIEIDTNLIPIDLLSAIKKIERLNDRSFEEKKNMPRTLDIDILVVGNLLINTPSLKIPHKSISERKFVLKPWNDIASNFIIINHNLSVETLLQETSDTSELNMVLILDDKL